MATIYEIDLACGDTISSAIRPLVGRYRKCIHCDGSKRVTGVRTPDTPAAVAPAAPGPDRVYVPDCALIQDPLF